MVKREIPVRARSSIRLGFYIATVGVFVLFFWGWNYVSNSLFLTAAFFVVVALLEFFIFKRKVPAVGQSMKQRRVLEKANVAGFELIEMEENVRHERSLEVGGRRIRVLLPEDELAFAAALPFAQRLIDHPEELSASSEALKRGLGHKLDLNEAKELAIDTVEFFNTRPEIAEVVFHRTSSGRFCVALYKNGELSNLHEET